MKYRERQENAREKKQRNFLVKLGLARVTMGDWENWEQRTHGNRNVAYHLPLQTTVCRAVTETDWGNERWNRYSYNDSKLSMRKEQRRAKYHWVCSLATAVSHSQLSPCKVKCSNCSWLAKTNLPSSCAWHMWLWGKTQARTLYFTNNAGKILPMEGYKKQAKAWNQRDICQGKKTMRPLSKQFMYLLQYIWLTILNLLHCLRLNRLKKRKKGRKVDFKIT